MAVGAGVIVGFVGPLAARAATPTLLRTAALIAGVAAGVFAAHQAAGLYGIGLAAVAALAVESLLKPTRTA